MPKVIQMKAHLQSHRHILIAVALIVAVCLYARIHVKARGAPLVGKVSLQLEHDTISCNQNESCCASLFSPADRPHRVANASASPSFGQSLSWRIAVHPAGDIVSNQIIFTGAWDAGKTGTLLNVLSKAGSQGTLLDIGANIGWFTLAAAYAGHRVIAVEPGAENLALLQHSLCLAPKTVRERVEVIAKGLGAKDGVRCEMWSTLGANRGNMYTVCDSAGKSSSAKWMRQMSYRKIGEAEVMKLDSLVAAGAIRFSKEEAVIVKIDVEGFEPLALAGAETFLREIHPRLLFAEYCPKMITRAAKSVGATPEKAAAAPSKFLEDMKKRGYSADVASIGRDGLWGPMYEAVFKRVSAD